MEKITTDIPDVFVLKTKVFADERGFFMESFNQRAWYDTTGLEARFVQDRPHGVFSGARRASVTTGPIFPEG